MNTTGHNDFEQNQSLKAFLLPSSTELVMLLVVSLIGLMLLNYSTVWQLVTDSSKLAAQTAGQSVQPQLDAISNFFRKDIFAQATVFLIWAMVGCIAYVIIGGLQHFFWRVKTEVDEGGYVKNTSTQKYWYARLAQYLYFLAASFLFVAFTVIFLTNLLPVCVELAETTIRSFKDLSSYSHLLLGSLLMMLGLYALTRLWKTVRYSFRVTFAKN
ncbi:MAG: hypothetical protein ABIQ89_03760 [Candidatus Saccharimonadales bacterium]